LITSDYIKKEDVMAENKVINKTYTMRIPVELYEKLEKEAERRKRSVNFIVNEKLEKAYKNNKR
jgi:predicted HicB family RNase H-like nuclease